MAAQVREQTVNFQGVPVPRAAVNPELFARLTRRTTIKQGSFAPFQGLGQSDILTMRQVGILSHLMLRITGTVTVTLGGGTCATTHLWPYGIIKKARFQANGVANLQNISGWGAKVLDQTKRGELNDRGITRGIGGAHPGTQVNQGSLSLASENWGLGSGTTAVAGGTYNVDLMIPLHIAADQLTLAGSVFAQTAATDLSLTLDYASSSDLFTLTGAATAVCALNVTIEGTVYSIPQGPNGIVLPDLSAFHQVTETIDRKLGNGENEIRFPGTSVGRQLLRFLFRTINNGAPLAVNATNYGTIGWRYGGNDTPEEFSDGLFLRQRLERLYGTDIGAQMGYTGVDFASEWAFRDAIDEGAASELRAVVTINNGVALTNPSLELIQEVMFAGAVGA